MTEMMTYPRACFEHFSLDRMYEGNGEYLMMAFDEDDLVFILGLSKSLMELSELMGNAPPIEMASLCSRFSEALAQFYGED